MKRDTDERELLYNALQLIEDALAGAYRLKRPAPAFAASHIDDKSQEAFSTAGAHAEAAFAAPEGIPDHDSLAAIANEAARCRKCRLASGRNRVVCGEGAERPLVLVIGEGPGAEEDRTGRPFVGPAGQLLDKMLAAIGLSRDANAYIANIVKCRPPMNRDPAPDEQAACLAYLDRQIALLRPRAILAAGRIPAQALLQTKDGIGKLRGKLWDYRGIALVATYHPSALLRNEELKRPAWEDLKLLKTILPDA